MAKLTRILLIVTVWIAVAAPVPSARVPPTTLQFVYGKLVEAGEYAEMRPGSMDAMSYVEMSGRHLPYTAPAGYRIGITGLCLSSKMNDRSSYLAVMGVYSHPDRVPCTVFPSPLWLTPTAILNGTIINNSGTRQWMIGTIQAVVAPIP